MSRRTFCDACGEPILDRDSHSLSVTMSRTWAESHPGILPHGPAEGFVNQDACSEVCFLRLLRDVNLKVVNSGLPIVLGGRAEKPSASPTPQKVDIGAFGTSARKLLGSLVAYCEKDRTSAFYDKDVHTVATALQLEHHGGAVEWERARKLQRQARKTVERGVSHDAACLAAIGLLASNWAYGTDNAKATATALKGIADLLSQTQTEHRSDRCPVIGCPYCEAEARDVL